MGHPESKRRMQQSVMCRYRARDKKKWRVAGWKRDRSREITQVRKETYEVRWRESVDWSARMYLRAGVLTWMRCRCVQRMRNVGDADALSSVLPRGRAASFAVSAMWMHTSARECNERLMHTFERTSGLRQTREKQRAHAQLLYLFMITQRF